ncbi:MAG: endonuclease [Tenericutes bacterium]|jgi:endonuclease I|nr:endonuclease [Mycoplasmatota bacterium]
MIKKILLIFVLVFSMGVVMSCSGYITTETYVTELPTTEAPTEEITDGTSDITTEIPTTEELTGEETTSDITTEIPTTEEPTGEETTTDITTEIPTTEVPTTEDIYYDDYIDLLDVHTMADGSQVEVSGVVYFMTQNGYYIQDDTYNLFIFTNTTTSVDLGDRIVISGDVTTYREVKQIQNPVLVETTAYEMDITQDVLNFEYGVTDLEPGYIYSITGEVRIEGTYNTSYLYVGNTKIAEIYYKSLSHSISAIESYAGEMITVDLLYYAVGDEVERFAFQGSSSHISVFIPDESEALLEDANVLPTEKLLFGNHDFGQGYYGSTYEITNISGDASSFVTYNGSYLNVLKPSEAEGDQTGVVTIQVSLGSEEPIIKTIDIIVKAEGSSTVDMAYYQTAAGLTGNDLFNELNAIISQGTGTMSYDYAKVILEESDRDPNNPSNVILVYTRESVKGAWDYPNWNREHVWPQSKLEGAPKGDSHNLKPSDVQENSSRGNLPFGYMTGSGVYEPHDEVKGDIARIIFYMATMYTQLNINSSTIGDLQILLEWHMTDPVDDFERNRNEVIYSYQGNRNPFIDYPQFVEEIWG